MQDIYFTTVFEFRKVAMEGGGSHEHIYQSLPLLLVQLKSPQF